MSTDGHAIKSGKFVIWMWYVLFSLADYTANYYLALAFASTVVHWLNSAASLKLLSATFVRLFGSLHDQQSHILYTATAHSHSLSPCSRLVVVQALQYFITRSHIHFIKENIQYEAGREGER